MHGNIRYRERYGLLQQAQPQLTPQQIASYDTANGMSYCNVYQLCNPQTHRPCYDTANGHILMVHMGTDPERTDKFYNHLPDLIKTLKKKGYNFVSLEEMVGLNMK